MSGKVISGAELAEKIREELKQEIAALKDEIETLRSWLDHSALPAMNPISKRPDSLGLIKLNFGKDKSPPELWRPGEKELMNSAERKPEEELSWPATDASPPEEFPELKPLEPLEPPEFSPEETEPPKIPEAPKPLRTTRKRKAKRAPRQEKD